MIKLSIFLSAILILMGCVTNANLYADMSLKTTSQKTESKPIKNLLIIGAGDIRSRIFLDHLAQEISGVFSVAKIQTENIMVQNQVNFDTLNYDKYDAFLFFSNKNAVWDNTAVKQFMFRDGNVRSYNLNSRLDGTLKLDLYQYMEDNISVIWQGDLKLDFDMSKEARYKKIAQLIYSELRKKNIITDPVK